MKNSLEVLHLKRYSSSEAFEITEHPELIRREPYKLFTSYFWNALVNFFDAEEDDEDSDDKEENDSMDIDGKEISCEDYFKLFNNCFNDFLGAASTNSTIQIKGKSYRVPDQDYPLRKLRSIFIFDKEDDYFIIQRSGLHELVNGSNTTSKLMQNRQDRIFFQKIVALAEDDKNNGWDELTDMEAAVYYWGFYLQKYQGDPLPTVDLDKALKPIKKELGIEWKDLEWCMKRKAKDSEINVMSQFSSDKIMAWNNKHKQKSIVDDYDDDKAYQYWINTAINGNFKNVR